MRRLILIALAAALLWFSAAVLVGGVLVATGHASKRDVLSTLICAAELCGLAWAWTRVRRGKA